MNTLQCIHNRPLSSGRCRAALRRFPLVSGAALLLCGFPCAAQQPPAGGQNLTNLEGVVVNALTGKPIPRALVQVAGGGTRAMLTGPQGEFSFDGVPVGTTGIHVLKPGFSQEGLVNARSAGTVKVAAGSGKVVIKLMPEGVITGQVTDAEGEPLEGVQIMVMHSEIANGTRRVVPSGRGQATDEDGNFRVGGLAPGKYYLAAKAINLDRRVLGAMSGNRRQAYPSVLYYPAAPDLEGASPLDLTAAQHITLQMSLKRVPAFKLTGTLAGIGDWKQVNIPWLTDRSGQVLAMPEKFDRATGIFEFQAVPAGSYFLRVGAMGESNQFTWTQRSVAIESDVTGLRMVLGAGTSIPVTVRAEFSADHSSGQYRSFSTNPNAERTLARVQLNSVDSNEGLLGSAGGPSVSNFSSQTVNNVTPGRYYVQVFPQANGYVYSAHSGGTNLLREPLVVPTEGSVPPIEITLRDDGGAVKIHVNSSQPPVKAWAVLAPEFAPRQTPVLLNVEPGTDRLYGGLAPGDYKVYVFDSTDGLEYANPDVLSRYNAKAVRVSVTSGGTASVGAELIHREEQDSQ